jgi:hypothetical protein
MRSHGGVVEQVLAWENLRLALARALRGCRQRGQARRFMADVEGELQCMRSELEAGTLRVGRFHHFTVYDPKRRDIAAPHFRERVLHHAIMNVCAPLLDRRLISDCYACREGRGQRGAVEQACAAARVMPFFLKMDVRRYFDSIDQVLLLEQLGAVFRERLVVSWFEQILGSYRTEPGKGLPIGSLISQHLANSYLASLDRYVKQVLGRRWYVRYMDDFVIWGRAASELVEVRDGVAGLLGESLHLELKPVPYINRTRLGMDFLGMQVYPGACRLSAGSRRRFRRRMRRCLNDAGRGASGDTALQVRAVALVAFTRGARAWQFRHRVLAANDFGEPSGARTGFSAAGAGTPTPGGAAPPTGTGGTRTTGTTTPVFVSPQLSTTDGVEPD